MLKRAIIIFSLICFIETLYSQKIPQSGYYDEAVVAVNTSTKKIIGYYDNKTGEEKFSCTFIFEGTYSSDASEIKVESYFPGSSEKLKGIIKLKDEKSFSLQLDEDHGGCWNVQSFVGQDVLFQLIKKDDWIDLKVIKSNKSFLYSEPVDNKKTKAYIIKNDLVKVKEIKEGWLKVQYDGKKAIFGWIKSGDCY